ncbi:MAG: flagellar hook-length control protein FliK [Lachnospiraceae bacterium]|nr:flagellar hook-length control protein FliK [Lachnospiraceae bacterium]
MTTGRITDMGIPMPYVNEAGGNPPVNGQDFMGKFKTAMETQATAINDLVPGKEQTPVQTQTSGDTPGAKEVSKASKAGADRENIKSNVEREPAKAGKGEVKAEDAEKAAETVTPETAEAIDEAVQSVIAEVAELLDLTPEEVQAAIEDLGMTMNDMLDPANMTGLVAALSGNQDTVTLLTDEDLYQTLGDLQEFVTGTRENLMSELDLSQEALNEVLDQTEELVQQPAPGDTDPIPTEVDPVAENPLEGMKDFKMTTTVNGESVSMDVRVDDTTGTQIVTNVDRSGSSESEQRQPSQEGSGHNDLNRGDRSSEAPLFTQTTQFNNDIQDFTELTDEVTSFRTESSDIANQIMENMRANIRPDVTELEMNLHPASLGNVRVNLTAQNGQVTAQFLAQNESVRAAIESQVVQLRETLEAQGVKIEAVEVAVAGQGFDRNRDSGGSRGENPEREAGRTAGIGRTRRIDLNAMEGDEAFEELEDADRIAAEMMAHDGNTVDYTA